MSKPENWFKALHLLSQAGKDSDSMEAALIRAVINDDGDEIVDLLAALYDAEHPQQEILSGKASNG